ncbi:MAG TPA: glycosyltransferase family 2 protein, partial [Methanocellaceae archaeon]
MSAKNKLVFALVLLILLAMGAAAGSIVYSAIFLASLVNRVFVQQWIPDASYFLLAVIVIVTAYFTVRFVMQCRSSEMPELKDSEI